MDDICRMKETICSLVSAQMNDLANVDTHELGEAVDIIKDFAIIEKECAETDYYKAVTKAMRDAEKEPYGYQSPHMPSHIYGYDAPKTATTHAPMRGYAEPNMDLNSDPNYVALYGYNHNMNQHPYIRDYVYDPEEFKETMRHSRMGYHDEHAVTKEANKYGKSYSDYMHAKRNYSETKSTNDKEDMNKYTNDYMYDVMANIKEMWADADPMMKERMKADLQKLVGSLV